MPFVDLDRRRASARTRYARRRPEMRAVAAQRRADPAFRENARTYSAAWRAANPVKRKDLGLRRDHGMTIDEFRDLWLSQGGVCAVCRRRETRVHQSGTPMDLSVDHDHATGRRRGLLCAECNLALGKFGDSPVRLAGAISYLAAHGGVQP
jgi:hypothetical protein